MRLFETKCFTEVISMKHSVRLLSFTLFNSNTVSSKHILSVMKPNQYCGHNESNKLPSSKFHDHTVSPATVPNNNLGSTLIALSAIRETDVKKVVSRLRRSFVLMKSVRLLFVDRNAIVSRSIALIIRHHQNGL
ncbi:hypothetical protein YC2023_096348 [Brassica napus]